MLKPSFRREDYNKKKREKFLIKIGLVFLLLALIFVGLVFLSRMQRFRISNVDFTGGLLISPDEIKTETQNFLGGNYFWFFPKNNRFLYAHDDLENFLKGRFKRIDTISIYTVDNQTIRITIKERGLYALWCEGQPGDGSPEKCYFMDNNGVVFSESPTFSGDAYFKYYGYMGNEVNPIGMTYLGSIDFFHDLSAFVERVKNTSVRPVYCVAKDSKQFDLILSDGGKVYVDGSVPFSKSNDNLEALLKNLSSATTTRDLNIDYIDLRFGNKLFYKLK